MRIGDLIGHKPLNGCLFGVEVEVEGAGLPRKVAGFNVVQEGSLRAVDGEEGKEYVFQHPMPYELAIDALEGLAIKLADAPIVQFSNRTSIHVHVNVTDLTVSEWFTFLFLWVVYEDAFINFCGNERKGNLFCLSSRDAEGMMFALEDFALTGNINNLNDEVRYSAVNTAATNKYGSVEFRSMRGTMDLGVLGSWLDALKRLRDKAQELGSPQALIEALLVDPEQFTCHIFPEGHFVHNYPGLIRYVSENVFRCALIVDCCNFDKFDFVDEPHMDI
jgi:hypothetical protein